jgi:hypothetical protein
LSKFSSMAVLLHFHFPSSPLFTMKPLTPLWNTALRASSSGSQLRKSEQQHALTSQSRQGSLQLLLPSVDVYLLCKRKAVLGLDGVVRVSDNEAHMVEFAERQERPSTFTDGMDVSQPWFKTWTKKSLEIPLIGKCQPLQAEIPLVPCLSGGMGFLNAQRWKEPIRGRDKDWNLTSYREALNSKPSFPDKLGKMVLENRVAQQRSDRHDRYFMFRAPAREKTRMSQKQHCALPFRKVLSHHPYVFNQYIYILAFVLNVPSSSAAVPLVPF